MTDVKQLVNDAFAAYEDVQAKLKLREEAALAHEAAHQAYLDAADRLAALQGQLTPVFAAIAPAQNPRVRIG